ncbi:TraR/DksA family transcriptional regulator [Stella sp.]|uniref:TraR/DksA family transcriptional regulator n=1 Tax=Stella sp. TaxID=2912054 RepID=UPI0035B39503
MATSDEGGHGRTPEAAARRRRSMLRRIDAALARIETGEYGWCAICGEQIAATRLDHEPTTAYCIACAGAARREDG